MPSLKLRCKWLSYEQNVFLRSNRPIFQVATSGDFCRGQSFVLSFKLRFPFSMFILISFPFEVTISESKVI